MTEQNFGSLLATDQVKFDLLQQRASDQRQRHKHLAKSLATVRNAVEPFLVSPRETFQRLPKRYLLHGIIALVVPVAFGLSQLPARPVAEPLLPQATTQTADAPLEIGPINLTESSGSGKAGVFPAEASDALSIPLPAESRSETLAPLSINATIVPNAVARVRNGPGLVYDDVTQLKDSKISRLQGGSAIQVVGRYGDWLQVREAEGKPLYWISNELVDLPLNAINAIAEVAKEDIPPPPPPKIGTANIEKLNLRDGPGTNYVKLTALKPGQQLDLLEQYHDWFHVAFGNVNDGWVKAEFLTIGPNVVHRIPVTEKVPDPNPPLVGVANSGLTNVRWGPSKAYEKIAAIQGGEEVDLLARYEDWYKVRLANGEKGWLFSDLLNIEPMVRRRVPLTNNIPALPPPPAPVIIQQPVRYVANQVQKTAKGTITYRAASSPVVQYQQAATRRPAVQYQAPAVRQQAAVRYQAPAVRYQAPAVRYQAPAVRQQAAVRYQAPATSYRSGGVAGTASRYVGSSYVYGGSGPGGFDCSGLTSYIYRQQGIALPHNAAAQYYSSGARVNRGNLAPGDLIFFAGTAGSGISHVGVYAGGGKMIHAATPGRGVEVTNLNSSYWQNHYYGATRPGR